MSTGRCASVIYVALTLMLTGCYTPTNLPVRVDTNKTAQVMEVDDTRGMVTMGSPYVYLEKPDVDWAAARLEAAAVCEKRLGKAHAAPVGPTRRTCISQVGSDCVRYAIVGDYECLASPR